MVSPSCSMVMVSPIWAFLRPSGVIGWLVILFVIPFGYAISGHCVFGDTGLHPLRPRTFCQKRRGRGCRNLGSTSSFFVFARSIGACRH
jgi:hypothetical protein